MITIYRLLHGWRVRTIFIHELWKITTNEWAQRTSELVIFHNEWIKSYKRENHEVICLSYEYKDECRVYTEYFSDTDRRL